MIGGRNLLQEMYKRREKMGYIFLAIFIVVVLGYILIWTPTGAKQWGEVSIIGLPVLFLIIIIIRSRISYQKLKDVEIGLSQASILQLDHVVLKKDASLLPRLLCFEKTGKYVGAFQLMHVSFWCYPLLIYNSSFINWLPVKFAFISNTGELIFKLKRKGMKKTEVTYYDASDNYIGFYIQKDFKSVLRLKGKLFDEKGKQMLFIDGSTMTGDFTWIDEHHHRWAYFYNGRFPHEYTTLFHDLDNDIVEVSDKLSQQYKQLLLGVIGFLFIQRTNK